ncbi:hypothetical protein J1C81_02095 [Streptococcus sanguinis]|uniref:Uncharacterized protein n=1 Tax=Streptococcus sanguinis SK330 TaxID=888813 RepID=F2C979_STRSA|nr:hypothetical protein [Streptococcus sanguinis]EGF13764.1 hypothetical protein HMPREF9386_1606 [Streptococcus sanguinis SK330]
MSAGNWTTTNDSVAKKSSEISDSFSDFDTGNWSRTSDTLADNASSSSKTVSDFTSGDWSRVSDSSSDKFSTSGLGLNDFTAGDWSHVSDFSDNRTSTSAAYSDLEADNWSRINDSFNNSASSTITATDDFTTGDWTRVTDAFGSQVSNKSKSLSDLTLGDWASVQDAASRTASLSPLEGEYTFSATKPTEDFVSTSSVNQWSGFNPVEGDWKQIDISEKSKTVNTPTMSEALADWAGFKQKTTSKEGLPGFALDYASSLTATGKNQLPGSFLDGDWQRVSESKPTSTLFNNPLATEDVLTNQTLPTTVDLGLSQTFSRTPEDYYQAGAMFAGPVSAVKTEESTTPITDKVKKKFDEIRGVNKNIEQFAYTHAAEYQMEPVKTAEWAGRTEYFTSLIEDTLTSFTKKIDEYNQANKKVEQAKQSGSLEQIADAYRNQTAAAVGLANDTYNSGKKGYDLGKKAFGKSKEQTDSKNNKVSSNNKEDAKTPKNTSVKSKSTDSKADKTSKGKNKKN